MFDSSLSDLGAIEVGDGDRVIEGSKALDALIGSDGKMLPSA